MRKENITQKRHFGTRKKKHCASGSAVFLLTRIGNKYSLTEITSWCLLDMLTIIPLRCMAL